MSTANSTAFPVKDQAFRCRLAVLNITTGLLITGGLTGLVAKISKDDAAAVSASGTPTESGMPGIVYLDLTAAEMNCNGLVVYLTATNTNAFAIPLEIVPLNLAVFTGTWDVQPVLLFEQIALDIAAYLYYLNQTVGGVQAVINPDSTLKAGGTLSSTQQGTIRSQLLGPA